MTDNPTPKRRWFRFSLRTLLIVVVLLSLPLGWVGIVAERTWQQKRAVADEGVWKQMGRKERRLGTQQRAWEAGEMVEVGLSLGAQLQ